MTDDELKAIEARANAATPVVLDEESYRFAYLNGGLGALVNEACCRYVGPNHGEYVSRVVNDAVGIAIRTDIPLLIADLRAAREALEESVMLQTHYAELLNMELGPLMFKPEDFDKTRCLFNRMSDFAWKGVTAVLRDEANALLAERLGKAPEVFLTKGYGHYDKWIEDESELDAEPTHRARLVCIEKLEGK